MFSRYQQEVEKYKKTDTYKKFIQDQENENHVKRKKKETLNPKGKGSNIIHQEVMEAFRFELIKEMGSQVEGINFIMKLYI